MNIYGKSCKDRRYIDPRVKKILLFIKKTEQIKCLKRKNNIKFYLKSMKKEKLKKLINL